MVVDGNVLGHGKHEGRLTHGRTGGNDDKVGILPTRSHLVELGKSTFQTTQTIGTGSRLLNKLVSLLNDRIDLRVVLLHVLLGNLEELSFSLLHQVVHIQGLVEGLGLNVAGESNELARQGFLRNDAGMIFDVCRRCHLAAELGDVERSSHLFQLAPLRQLLLHRKDIHRLLVDSQVGDSRIYQLVTMLVK